MRTYSYRELEAYRLARHLLVGGWGDESEVEREEPEDLLDRTALSVAMNLVDGTQCDDAQRRRDHFAASLAATDRLERLIRERRDQGRLTEPVAEELLELQRRAAAALRSSLKADD